MLIFYIARYNIHRMKKLFTVLLTMTLLISCVHLQDNHTMEHQHTNRLIDETSPYLLQHAYNPVDWYPWGDEAFSKAKAENKMLIVSIGYSACHWCHVMEHESFEDDFASKVIWFCFENDMVFASKMIWFLLRK